MKNTFVALALVASALASPKPQAVTASIAPQSSAPAGCSASHSGQFEISVVNVTKSARRSIDKRQLAGVLKLTLADGTLKDQAGRTGYIASNFQFQFDSPPQAGALITTGFSYCSNNTLALGGSAIFYQCYSGGFFNLYDRSWAKQCVPIYLVTSGSSSPATQLSDGQPGATPITQKSDGQPVQPTVGPVTILTDGQPQAGTSPLPQPSSGVPVSQISDGQIQASPKTTAGGVPVSQISDGQIQASPKTSGGGVPVSQISDGQIQAPPKTTAGGVPVSQISDGQIIASTPAPSPAPTGPVVSQLTDGQPQVPATANATFTSSNPAQFTGAAAKPGYGIGAAAAGLLGMAALL